MAKIYTICLGPDGYTFPKDLPKDYFTGTFYAIDSIKFKKYELNIVHYESYDKTSESNIEFTRNNDIISANIKDIVINFKITRKKVKIRQEKYTILDIEEQITEELYNKHKLLLIGFQD